MLVEIDITKSVEKNAELYYEKAKKAKKKLAGAEKTLVKFKEKLADYEKEEKEYIEQKEEKIVRKKQWFEKFRWFLTSTGFLVIGGRDATTNEIVIKKHTEPHDLVFHTDMAGSPFFVIKTEKKDIDDQTKKEVADATASFSRAWKNGLSSTSVFYVSPDQVTKEANSGEYLTKGAFMIRGKTNYVENSTSLAVGKIDEGEYKDMILCTSPEAVKKYCKEFFLLEQSEQKVSDLAKALKKTFGVAVDEIVRSLPPGSASIKKERRRKK